MEIGAQVLTRFQHVRVITTIRRSHDYESGFCDKTGSQEERDEDSNLLTYAGYLKAIDPITKSVVLCKIDSEEVTGNILILGHNVARVTPSLTAQIAEKDLVQRIVEEDTKKKLSQHPYFRDKSDDKLDPLEVLERQSSILKWMERNRIPASVDKVRDEIIIAGDVRIRPPYERESDYICPTRLILKRVKSIVDSSGCFT